MLINRVELAGGEVRDLALGKINMREFALRAASLRFFRIYFCTEA